MPSTSCHLLYTSTRYVNARTHMWCVCQSVCMHARIAVLKSTRPAKTLKRNNCFFFFLSFLEKNTSFVLLVEGVMVVNNRVGVNGRERKEGRKGFYSNYKPDNIRVYGNRFIRCDIELELSL